ncbi:MAG TPA: hypothetical protein VKG23_16790, partial [Thermoanaerobaculia bacterium]|nr:hypothetical protein [Thermoanaerobaculia bacterium]
ILKEEPPDLSETNQSVPPALDRVVRHCLEKSPERRFHSAHDLAFDLEALSGVSSAARPTVAVASRTDRRWLLAGRAAALALVALAIGFVAGRGKAPAVKASDIVFSQLTFRQEPIFNARFSPDGKTVVYAAAPFGNAPEIYSLRPDFPGTAPAGRPGMMLLSVSSKGELAILTRPLYIRHSVYLGTLARMPLEGGAPREIVEGVREADWAPDGSDLVVVRDVNGKDRIEFPLGHVLAETGGWFSNPRFSRKGDRIAFFDHPQRFDDRGGVAVVDLSGKKTTLSDGYWGEEGLAWSASGDEVMFSAGRAYNNFEIYAVTLAGRRRTALQSAGGLTILDVAADGRWIASRDDLWKEMSGIAPGESRERNLAWLDLSYAVALSPDGKTLLFTEESGSMGGNYATCIRQTDGSPVVRLGEGAAFDLSMDGKWALSDVPANPPQLVLYPTGAGQPRKLEPGGIMSYESAVVFPDGRRVLACGHEAGKATRCYVQDVDGGKPRPLTPEGTTGGIVSPDGKQVLVSDAANGYLLFPADGGAGRPVPGSTPDDVVIRWTADGSSLLVANDLELPVRVARLDIASGRRDPYRTVGPPDLAGAIHIDPVVFSADGRAYVYTVRRMASHLFLVSGAR